MKAISLPVLLITNMLLPFLLILLGLMLLVGGARYLVQGASSLAKRLAIPEIVIGLTVVAFGTSAPELIVNILSAFNGTTDLALGNIVGSNIANILLILGGAGLIASLPVNRNTAWKEIPFAILASLVLLIMSNDVLFDGAATNTISRTDGLILLGFFGVFMWYTVNLAFTNKGNGEEEIHTYSLNKSIFFTLCGCLGLFLGGKLLVDNAIILATLFGIPERIIGLTIVAVGTSLPELATSVIAAKQGKTDIAIGNVVGSNIFNIFWILGVGSIITVIPVSNQGQIDLLVALGATILLFIGLFINKKYDFERRQAGLFIALYIGYLIFLIV